MSHPVALTASIDTDGSLYGAHTPGYGETDSMANPLVAKGRAAVRKPHRPMGLSGIIDAKKEETEQVAREVHQGFRDLEVRVTFDKRCAVGFFSTAFMALLLHFNMAQTGFQHHGLVDTGC